MIGLAIHPLVEHADAIPRIAAWFYDEWREIYGKETLASVQRRIATWLAPDQVPTALVAVLEGRVVGTVALKESELQFTYSPWLAGLFVIPEMRRKGIGALLVNAAERKAASLGVDRLYLYTPGSRAFYERQGWLVLQHCQLPTGPVAVMSKPLQPTLKSAPST